MLGLHTRHPGLVASMLLCGACSHAPSSGEGSTADSGSAASTADSGSPPGPAPSLPTPSADCPALVDGMVTFTVDGTARDARVWLDPAASAAMDGPLVFYWYGTGGEPSQANAALGDGLATITGRGGLVVAPVHVNGGPYPWLEQSEADHRLVDEVVACAAQDPGIDARQIHALGFSAGGLFTSGLSFARSSILASVATYSGGGTGTLQDPEHVPAAMIFHGGADDEVAGFGFQAASEEYQQALATAGGFTVICDHGQGHTIPSGVGPAIVQFWLDHPFGLAASPYAGGLPPALPDYCVGS
ncbi:MAG: hypothetical protein KDK70_21080 [Myxococcales bacterium]|nr:hypothetical protein [Myxococcales bacterium]